MGSGFRSVQGRFHGRAIAVALLFAGLASMATAGRAPIASAAPSPFYGMDLAQNSFDSEADWEAIEKSGARRIHVQFNWYTVATQGGWANTYDRYVAKAARHNEEILPYLYGRKDGGRQYYTEAEWGPYLSEFVTQAVQRYGYNGSFWKANPSIPYRPIWAWEIWNEPNFNVNSPGENANGATYAKFLRANYETIQSAQNAIEPGSHFTAVLFGGIYQPDRGIDLPTYLQQAKNAGIGISAYFNGLSFHPYGFGTPSKPATTENARLQSVIDNTQQARGALSALCASCSGKSLWITEMGWGVAGTGNTVRSAKEQSNLLFSAYDWLSGAASALNIQYVAWYLYADVGCCGTWDQYSGLRGDFGAYRSSWFAYEGVTNVPKWPSDVTSVWPSDNLSGEITGDPDIDTWTTGNVAVFARGTDSGLYQKYYANGWSQWFQVPNSVGRLAGGPSAVAWANGRHDVVARGANGQVLHWSWDSADPQWYFDESLGGVIQGDPDLSSWGKGRLDLFARGMDDHLWHRWYNGTWGPWEPIPGGTLGGGPSAVCWGEGRIDVVARGSSGQVLHWSWDKADSQWYFDESLGGQITSDPAISSRGPGRLDVFARGTDYRLVHRSYNSGTGWGPWEQMGGSFLDGGPGAVSWGSNRIDVVARAYDDSVYHTAYQE